MMLSLYRIALFAVSVTAVVSGFWSDQAAAGEFVLVRDGQPAATIVVAAAPTAAAAFAAQEIQYHVQKITGAVLPIKSDADKVDGVRVLVGPSKAVAQSGVDVGQFKDQEYLIRFDNDTLILVGKDVPSQANVAKANDWTSPSGTRLPPPSMQTDQATSYAVHDFLERFCDVRWFGPGELEMVVPTTATLAVEPKEIHRSPGFVYRHPWGPQKIITEQWNHASGPEIDLFFARLRAGGEQYSVNHSFDGYYDRFWEKNPNHPERFVAAHHDWFAREKNSDGTRRPEQMCFSNQGLVDQTVADARKFFDSGKAEAGAKAEGNYFGVVPMDRLSWCLCPACQAHLTRDRNQQEFSDGIASDYFFAFVDKVAREVGKTHPDKFIATLAYSDYAYRPLKVDLPPNVSVQMCLQIRHPWAPGIQENDHHFYRDWVDHDKGRRFYVWLYYHFPEFDEAFHCFPGFCAHHLDKEIKMYARDGIRGAFLNNLGEQVDLYITLKLFDDPSLNIDTLLDDFFGRYYGAAGEPLKRMYLRIEEIFSDPANYPEEVRTNLTGQYHQTEEMAWKYLGTEPRMAELAAMMAEAEQAPVDAVEKQRVALFRKAIWDYMVEGRQQYLAKQQENP
jgi:hypothetical protein